METPTTLALKAQKGDHEAMVYFYQLFQPLLLKEFKRAGELNNVVGFKTTNKHHLAFSNKENKFCGPGQPNDWYDMFVNKYNLKKRIILHEFRKTHVSLCAMADVKLEDILYRFGHKDSKMTKQVYNYFYPEREEHSADKFV